VYLSFEKLRRLIESKGYSVNRLVDLGVISDTAARQLREDSPRIILKHVVAICEYFDVNVEDYIETIRR